MSITIGEKYGVAVFHPSLLVGRSSSWGKLPLLWLVLQEIGQFYDYFFFLDSDAVINPHFSNRSLFDAMTEWERDQGDAVAWGNRNPWSATFLFFNNFPWKDDLPCAGVMIFKTKGSESFFREWWDYNIPSKNTWDFMEQDALWYMLTSPEYRFQLNSSTVSVLVEPQFPSDHARINDLWVCHVPNYVKYRTLDFRYL